MSEQLDLIEAQAEHIEALEAELADLDARLGSKAKRRNYDALATQHRSPDAIVRTQDRVIEQLESELVRGYAELGEKVKRKRGKRDENDTAAEETSTTRAEPGIRPAVEEGIAVLWWYVAQPQKLEMFVLSHSIFRRERAMQRAILAATYGPLALLAAGYLLAALLTLPASPLPLITTALATYGLFRAAKHDFGRVVFRAQDKFGWSYVETQVVAVLCLFTLALIYLTYPQHSDAHFIVASPILLASALIGIAQSAMLNNMAKVLNLPKNKAPDYQFRALKLATLHGAFLTGLVMLSIMGDYRSFTVFRQVGESLLLLGAGFLLQIHAAVGAIISTFFMGLAFPTSFGERLLPNPHPAWWKTLFKKVYWSASMLVLLAAFLAYIVALLALFI